MADMANNLDAEKRVTVRYDGRVQGIGFRFTAMQIAEGFPVTGYVQNMPDGSVKMVAEGTEKDLLQIIRRIKESHLGRYITGERFAWSDALQEFSSFTVRYER